MSAHFRRALATSLVALLAACSDAQLHQRSEELERTVRQEQLDHFVRTFAVGFPARAGRAALAVAREPALQDVALAEDGLHFESDVQVATVLRDWYAAHGWQARFVQQGRLTASGQAVVTTLATATDHGLHAANYHSEEIAALLAELGGGAAADQARNSLQLSAEEQQTLLAWLLDDGAVDGSLPAADAVFARLTSTDASNPLPHIPVEIRTLGETISQSAVTGPRLELRLMAAVIRWGRDQVWSNAWLTPRDVARTNGWDLENAEVRARLVPQRVVDGLSQLMQANDFAGALSALHPPGTQYAGLVAGVREYRNYALAGGWEALTFSGELRPGQRHAIVPALRRRLAAENYFTGDLASDENDAALRRAVEHYQTTHQLSTSGLLNEETVRSLNVPPERRMAQLMATQQRWRQTHATRDTGGEYIFVNIPDFHAELWDRGERVYRWRTVVGRSMNVRQGNRMVTRGRTPSFSDTMLYVVFNPYWNVPQSIRRSEYDVHINSDPNWLADNHFELIPTADGGELLRQTPGNHNALGRVKFLFPNEHDVYMHDTPTKHLFGRPIRAFSHGCIRVQDPLDLSALLLSRDRGWTLERTLRYQEELLARPDEQWVTLTRPLSIHIDYFVTRAGDDGRMEFLADIYRYDTETVETLEARLIAELNLAAHAPVADDLPVLDNVPVSGP